MRSFTSSASLPSDTDSPEASRYARLGLVVWLARMNFPVYLQVTSEVRALADRAATAPSQVGPA